MTEEDIASKGKGAVHEPDSRDLIFGAANTPPFDWSTAPTVGTKTTLVVRDQAQSESCVGQTHAEIADLLTSVDPHSARYIYSQIFQPGGGASMRDGMNLLCTQVVALESIFPSAPETEAHMEDKIGIMLTMQAVPRIYSIVLGGIDAVAQAIRDHRCVSIGVRGDNAGWTSADVLPPSSAVWGHDVTGIQAIMRNGQKAIMFLNHWTANWGDEGYGYLPESYFTSGNVMVTYVMTDNYINPSTLMNGFKSTSSPDVYVEVGNKLVKVGDWNTFVSLGGSTASVCTLPDTEFAKLQVAGNALLTHS